MRVKISCLLPVLCVVAVAGASAQTLPQFPQSELRRGHEGWVVIEFPVSDNGPDPGPTISDSSGNDAFNDAALEAARSWAFDPDEPRRSSTLVNFVFSKKRPWLSKKFTMRYAKIHRAIDKDKLDVAEERLAEIRQQKDMNAFELAYSYLAEGRIAGVRGDTAAQIACFRKATLNQGHWVTDETYEKLLFATMILGLKQNDVASAVRDYDLLVELESTRATDNAIERTIERARQYLAATNSGAAPYTAASLVVNVVETAPRNLEDSNAYTGVGVGWSLSSDRADTPPATN